FAYLRALVDRSGGLVSRAELESFVFEGRRVRLLLDAAHIKEDWDGGQPAPNLAQAKLASSVMSTLPRIAFEMGHASSAVCAAALKPSSFRPLTTPRTTRRMVVTPTPSPTSSRVQVARTSSESGGVPAFAKVLEKAIA